jgi:hypothetical protein
VFDRVRHCLFLDKMSSDVEPAHKNGKLCFKRYFGYFGRSTGQPFGATLLHLVCTYVRVLVYADDMKLFLIVMTLMAQVAKKGQ